MTENHVEEVPKSDSKNLSCPDCGLFWIKCQCSTKEIPGADSSNLDFAGTQNVPSQSANDRLFGTTVASKYEMLSVLGEGGMGGVYLAEHVTLKKKVALKILRKSFVNDEIAIERLRREAQSCALLNHPNIISVFDFGITDNGFPYIVMDYLDGIDLSKLADLDTKRSANIFLDICKGLNEAHRNGVVHRDLKPTNIIITNPGTGKEKATIVDFGIAKSTPAEGEVQFLTQTGEVLGSPAYMSPEQITGEAIDARSDIYSLGCILYELLTGKQLFRGHSLLAVLEANQNEDPPDLLSNKSNSPTEESLYILMYKCLEKDATQRMQSVAEIITELEPICASMSLDKKKKSKT